MNKKLNYYKIEKAIVEATYGERKLEDIDCYRPDKIEHSTWIRFKGSACMAGAEYKSICDRILKRGHLAAIQASYSYSGEIPYLSLIVFNQAIKDEFYD